MSRFTLALVASLLVLAPASAALSARKDSPPPLEWIVREPPPPQPKPELVITEGTDIRLDGRPCKYADVPANAQIILIDVASDHHTVQKLYFRSKK